MLCQNGVFYGRKGKLALFDILLGIYNYYYLITRSQK